MKPNIRLACDLQPHRGPQERSTDESTVLWDRSIRAVTGSQMLRQSCSIASYLTPAVALLLAVLAGETDAQAVALRTVGAPQMFSYAALKDLARDLASEAYQAPTANLPEPIA